MSTLDYAKLPASKRVTVWIAPSGGTTLGVTEVQEPLTAEVNNTGGTAGTQPASQSISWSDYGFGVQESETTNEPSLADAASFEEFGAANYGGSMSFFLPAEYDDDSNQHSVIHNLTEKPGYRNDVITRIDGDLRTSVPAADGQFVSVFRTEVGGQSNPFQMGQSKRRTVNFLSKGDFSHFTVLGAHTITAIPPATDAWDAGRKGRLRASIQGRDVTNMLEFRSSDPSVVVVYPGGFYEVVGTADDTATITISEPGTANTATQAVTVTAP